MARSADCCRWDCRGTFKATAASGEAGGHPGFPETSLHEASEVTRPSPSEHALGDRNQ